MRTVSISIARILIHVVLFLLIMALCLCVALVYINYKLPHPKLFTNLVGWIPVIYLFVVMFVSKKGLR